jgi:hypothetical protein
MNSDDDVRQKTGSTHGVSDECADHLRAAADSLGDVRTDLTHAVERSPGDTEALINEHSDMASQLQDTLRELAINVEVLEEADE